VQLPSSDAVVVLVLKADGYFSLSKSVVPDRDQALALALKKKPVARARPQATKDDIIDVQFGGK
jgi:hypothetical protein